jgi:hypothetical protein
VLTLALATFAVAQSPEARGTVARLDAPANVIMLEDGRMYRVTSSTVVLVDDQPVPVTAVQPGSVVVLRSPEFVTLRDGQYVVAGAPSSTMAAPAGLVVAATPSGATVKRTIYGKVTDVDRDGEVKIKTDKGSFEIQLTPDTVRNIRKGDTVMIDATFAPPGTPVR